jgi:excisionase family DNA binding protein
MKKIVVVGQPQKPGGEKYLTRKEVAARFKVDVRTIDNWRVKYQMPHYCVGGQVRFKGSEVDAWMKTRRRGGPLPRVVEADEQLTTVSW